jgi:allantoinase
MQRAAQLGKLVAVHAESEAITAELSQAAVAEGRTTVRDYLDSRPIFAELDAIQRAVQLAGETKCALHIVHVSSGAGLALVASARKQGVNVSAETCPHYLVLTEADAEALGAPAKCAPPLRTKSAQEVLWRYVANGSVSTIGSDHSPAPPELKADPHFFKVWGGISGVQHTLPLLITEGIARRRLALSLVASVTSFNVAERFKLPPTKGRLAVGADADFALVDLGREFTVRREDLQDRHRQSPYVGRALTGRVVRTILRGQTIFRDGVMTAPPMGRLVKPQF